MPQSQITITGNLGDDPELRFTPSGAPVCKFSVGVTDRFRDRNTNEWRDGDTTWFTVIAWNQMAENCAETLLRGTRVVVTGQMKSRSWETKEGEKRTSWEITADDVGASLRFTSANIRRAARTRPTTPERDDTWAGTDTSPAPGNGGNGGGLSEFSGHGSTEPAQSATSEAHEPAQPTSTSRGRRGSTTAPASS